MAGLLLIGAWVISIGLIVVLCSLTNKPGRTLIIIVVGILGINLAAVLFNKLDLAYSCGVLPEPAPPSGAPIVALNLNASPGFYYWEDQSFLESALSWDLDLIARDVPFVTARTQYDSVTSVNGRRTCAEYAGYSGTDPICLLDAVPASEIVNVAVYVDRSSGWWSRMKHTKVVLWRESDGDFQNMGEWNQIEVTRNTAWYLYMPIYWLKIGECMKPKLSVYEWLANIGSKR